MAFSRRHVRPLAVVCLLCMPLAAGRPPLSGSDKCPCLDEAPMLANLTVNTVSNEHSRTSASGKNREPITDCLLASNVDRLLKPGETYCYPTDYGLQRCTAWDMRLLPECATRLDGGHGDVGIPEACKGPLAARNSKACDGFFQPKGLNLPWCGEPWCYVDKDNCDKSVYPSYVFPDKKLFYSYDTCDTGNYFVVWGAAQLDMCHRFEVVEKPFLIMWLSCWACAFMQQIIDATRLLEEQQDRLSKGQRLYLGFQLVVLVTETFSNVKRIPWTDGIFWTNYNLYVYVFINSSVFVRATMMSQIVWDWYNARLLKFPVLPFYADGKGWTEEERAGLLVVIFQFLSSLGVFGVITLTHILPALFCYYWIFLLVAAGLVKSRDWVAAVGLNPESRFGRALVMGTNSFISCTGVQLLVTSMVRAYAGEWKAGYFGPLRNDFLSRRAEVWYACHLGKGVSTRLMRDQDFINLFVR